MLTVATNHKWLWNSLEKWSATVFLLAGGLSLVGTILGWLGALTSMSMRGPASMAVFAGVVLSFVALLGLYPQLASRAARAAQVGILLILFPLLFTVVLLVWHSPELAGIHVPSLLNYLPSPALVYLATFVLTAVGLTVYGVGGLRTDAFAPVVGGLLLVLAAAWLFLVGAAGVYGFPMPNWVANVQTGIMGVALVGIGYRLRTSTVSTDHVKAPSDSTSQ